LGGNAVAVTLAVLLLGGAGFAGYQMVSGEADGSEPTAASPTSPARSAAHSGTHHESSAPAPTTPAQAPKAKGPTDTLPAGCARQLDAGTKAIAAADQSYRDWHGHTQADLDYRAGKKSWAATRAIWADTKKRGASDVTSFRTARGAYTQTAGEGCVTIDRATAGPKVVRCLDRFRAMDVAIGAGGKVNDDWHHHVQMMKRKDHTNPAVYTKEWRSMVNGAGPSQTTYRNAKAAYDRAPSCER
jgi:hypothetical protein